MSIFLLISALFLLGMSVVASSPVPSGKGKRIVLFLLGTALWVGAIILVQTQQEALVEFLVSDYALTGPFGAQMAATIFVFGVGWFVFVVSSFRMERQHTTQFDRLWYDTEPKAEVRKVFRPWPSLLIWIPVGMVLVAIWLVPYHFGDIGVEPTVTPTKTATLVASATSTSTVASTATPTRTPTATPEPTVTPTISPTATPEPTNTPANTNPNMPSLACGGEWLHEKPFKIGEIRQALERCPNGDILLHYPDTKTEPQLFQGMSIMTTVPPYRLEFTLERDGTIAVNGVPFTEWFESQGGE